MMRIKQIATITRKIISVEFKKRLPSNVQVIFISKEVSRNLNKTYQKKNGPTNVLSFLYSPEYGEILICPEIVKKEAKIYRNSQDSQMTWMIVHGMIHLAGIHHEDSPAKAKRFVFMEKDILQKISSLKFEARSTKS